MLRYLSDAYRALRQTVPERVKTEELDDIIEWLGETVRQIDSSLLDEWEALTDPEAVAARGGRRRRGEPPRRRARSRPTSAPSGVMVRNAMFQKVQLAARDRFERARPARGRGGRLSRPARADDDAPRRGRRRSATTGRSTSRSTTGPAARAPELLMIDRAAAPTAGPGPCARSSTIPRATTTGRSWRPSTSTPRTPPASR